MSPRIGSHNLYVVAPHRQPSTSSDDESTECVHRGFSSKNQSGSVMPMTMDMMGDDIWWQMNQEFACSSSSGDEDDACMTARISRKAARPQPSPSKKNTMPSIPEDAWMAMNQDFACEHHPDEEMEEAPRAPAKTKVPAAEELVGDWGVWWE